MSDLLTGKNPENIGKMEKFPLYKRIKTENSRKLEIEFRYRFQKIELY